MAATTLPAERSSDRASRIALWDSVTSVLALGLLVVTCVARLEPFMLLPLATVHTVLAIAIAIACRPRMDGPL